MIAPRDLADVAGAQVVESYFDLAIRPRPPRGVVLFAPCSFNSLNKLAQGIADNLALSVAAEAIGRGTPVIVGPSLNQPLLDHPQAQASLQTLPTWGVTVVPMQDDGEGRAWRRPSVAGGGQAVRAPALTASAPVCERGGLSRVALQTRTPRPIRSGLFMWSGRRESNPHV